MARETRRPARPGAGPGRGTPRTRASARPRTGRPGAGEGSSVPHDEVGSPLLGSLTKGLSLTRRALALAAVVGLLFLSFASSLRVYFTQQQEIAQRRQEIAESNLRIYELQDRLRRWDDPAYVKAQARERLGWVVPGETGYVVLGPDGRPIAGSTTVTQHRGLDTQSRLVWWQQLWDSVVTADHVGSEASDAPRATPRPSPSRITLPTPTPTTTAPAPTPASPPTPSPTGRR